MAGVVTGSSSASVETWLVIAMLSTDTSRAVKLNADPLIENVNIFVVTVSIRDLTYSVDDLTVVTTSVLCKPIRLAVYTAFMLSMSTTETSTDRPCAILILYSSCNMVLNSSFFTGILIVNFNVEIFVVDGAGVLFVEIIALDVVSLIVMLPLVVFVKPVVDVFVGIGVDVLTVKLSILVVSVVAPVVISLVVVVLSVGAVVVIALVVVGVVVIVVCAVVVLLVAVGVVVVLLVVVGVVVVLLVGG